MIMRTVEHRKAFPQGLASVSSLFTMEEKRLVSLVPPKVTRLTCSRPIVEYVGRPWNVPSVVDVRRKLVVTVEPAMVVNGGVPLHTLRRQMTRRR